MYLYKELFVGDMRLIEPALEGVQAGPDRVGAAQFSLHDELSDQFSELEFFVWLRVPLFLQAVRRQERYKFLKVRRRDSEVVVVLLPFVVALRWVVISLVEFNLTLFCERDIQVVVAIGFFLIAEYQDIIIHFEALFSGAASFRLIS